MCIRDRLHADSIDVMEGCTITLHRYKSIYQGSTNGRDCPNSRSGAAYATSEVTIRSDRMMSWDRGYDDAGKQVWGATKGGYLFLKKRKY